PGFQTTHSAVRSPENDQQHTTATNRFQAIPRPEYPQPCMSYDFQKIEAKWQERWAESGFFEVKAEPGRPKFYNLTMYPYPSGALHQGHVRNYTYGDLLTRYMTMRGYNVLSP